MKVITSNPVVTSGEEIKTPSEMYYNSIGAIASQMGITAQQAAKYQEEQNKKGLFWDKVRGGWKKAKESGLIDQLRGFASSQLGRGQSGSAPVSTSEQTATQKSESGMSNTTKILIGVGVVALIGFAIYKSNKS
jgi:hypothetical protein